MATGPQDFPDYQRLAQQALSAFVNQALIPIPNLNPITLPDFYVGNISQLHLRFFTGTTAELVSCSVAFFDDQAHTVSLGGVTVFAANPHAVLTVVPVLGAFCTIGIQASTAGGGGLTYSLFANGISGVNRPTQLVGADEVIRASHAGVAAGAIVTDLLATTYPGDWQAVVASDQTGCQVFIEQMQQNGVWRTVGNFFTGTTSFAQTRAFIAAAPTRVRSQNNAGVAAGLTTTLVPAG